MHRRLMQDWLRPVARLALAAVMPTGSGSVFLLACGRDPSPHPSPRPQPEASAAQSSYAAATSPANAAELQLPPLSLGGKLIELPVLGHGPATVVVPPNITRPRPVVIGVHGHSIRPEEACQAWRRATHDYPFVLCPHGLPANAPARAPVTLGTAQHTAREIAAGLQTLKSRFGRYLADSSLVYAGFSLGARLGVAIVSAHPDQYPLVVLGEGGYGELTQPVIRKLAADGVRRVLLVCSTKACEISYAPVQRRFERSGIECRIASSSGNVHRFRGAVVEQTRRSWPWLVRDQPAYRRRHALPQ